MSFAAKSAAALVLVLVLSACGGSGAQDSEATSTDAPEATGAPPAGTASATPADAATPEPAPSETAPGETTAAAPAPAPSASAPAAPVEPAAFAMCKACHSVEPGKNGIGPSLAGIWGEKAGDVPGFDFSQPMKDSGLVWNQATLDRYLADPRGVVPGTKMAFGGVKDAAKRQELIDYIKGL